MTKTTLLGILSGGAGAAGFDIGKKSATTALDGFEGPVLGPIKNKTYWSGEGQADAESVLQTNGLALEITELSMEAGAGMMETATLQFSQFAGNMMKLEARATSMDAVILEDGKVKWREGKEWGPGGASPGQLNRRLNLEVAARQTLGLAIALDQSTSQSLLALYENAPEVVETAADAAAALPRNKQVFLDALNTRSLVLEVAATWSIADAGLIGIVELDKVGDNRLPAKAFEFNQELENLIKSGIGVTKAGPFLNALTVNLPGLLVDGIGAAAEATGKSAETAGRTVLAKLGKLASRGVAAINWAQFTGDLAVFLAGKLAPEGYPTTHPVVDPNGEVQGHVNDFELSHIASGYYFTHGFGGGKYPDATIADVARAQQAGVIEPGQYDYVAEAKQVRANLQQWLDTHPGDNQNPDRVYAEQLIAEIDAAVE